jgi:hypothetical protein
MSLLQQCSTLSLEEYESIMESHNMTSDKDIFTKEIESWVGFGYALRKENRILFEEMLDRCKKKGCVDCTASKGENFSAEGCF